MFEHNSHAIGQELTVFVPFEEDGPRDPVKICRLRLRNDSSQETQPDGDLFRGMGAGYAAGRSGSAHQHQFRLRIGRRCWRDSAGRRQRRTPSHLPPRSRGRVPYSGERGAFLGRNGSRANPAALKSVRLDNAVRRGTSIPLRRCRSPYASSRTARPMSFFCWDRRRTVRRRSRDRQQVRGSGGRGAGAAQRTKVVGCAAGRRCRCRRRTFPWTCC